MKSVEWYIEYIKKEMDVLVVGDYTGKITFEVNFKQGGIANLNCQVRQSVKEPER